MKKKVIFSLLIVTVLLLVFAIPVFAQEGLIPPPSQGGDGDYALNDFLVLAIKISQLILGLVGSLSLLAFVTGGVMFMISGGSSDKVEKAKRVLIAAVVGLVIVFASWIIIRFVILSLGSNPEMNSLEVDINKIPTPAAQVDANN